MTKQRRLAAVILAVLVLVAVMTSLFVMLHAADHDCIGEDCPVCAAVASCRNTLKTLCGGLLAAAVFFACFRFAASVVPFVRVSFHNETPIALKVKLLN